jgi:hypothetical protein
VAGPGHIGHDHAAERSGDRGHAGSQRALSERAAQTVVAQWDMHTDGQHQHGEAGLCQERHRRVVGMNDIQAAATERHSGEDLADDDRHEAPPAGRKQRTREAGRHNQCEVAEARQASLRVVHGAT